MDKNERIMILQMLSEGKINVDESVRLLDALKPDYLNEGVEKVRQVCDATGKKIEPAVNEIKKVYKKAEPKIKEAAEKTTKAVKKAANDIQKKIKK